MRVDFLYYAPGFRNFPNIAPPPTTFIHLSRTSSATRRNPASGTCLCNHVGLSVLHTYSTHEHAGESVSCRVCVYVRLHNVCVPVWGSKCVTDYDDDNVRLRISDYIGLCVCTVYNRVIYTHVAERSQWQNTCSRWAAALYVIRIRKYVATPRCA